MPTLPDFWSVPAQQEQNVYFVATTLVHPVHLPLSKQCRQEGRTATYGWAAHVVRKAFDYMCLVVNDEP